MAKIELPYSEIYYYPDFFDSATSDVLFTELHREIEWRQDNITVYGKTHLQPRLTAWYADEGLTYTYSNLTMYPNPWIDCLEQIKDKIEFLLNVKFNSVLLNYYRHGKDSMGWHSDNEPELGKNPLIASVSFGGERRFMLKTRDKKNPIKSEISLTHGSLLVMAGETQHYWLHQIPKTSKSVKPRINLTFRLINQELQ
ncbi:Alkylated DNA repair protein AlkB [Cyanobacterium sp. HL-69]|uniref:alpha-ketoglutarate-dependent dioxygenase AlkB family protein n=1 Tax=Cyanobacterium sp. HL-69 TaxID=2054282 RepID=UPI000CA0F28C|nr:Alkylated DNA repair protein AlkB [Cyanobacterium sp. HL-69]